MTLFCITISASPPAGPTPPPACSRQRSFPRLTASIVQVARRHLPRPPARSHNASSGADIVQDFVNQFTRQEAEINTVELEYDFSRSMTAYIGYRYEHRDITANNADNQVLTFFPSLANRGVCAGQPLVNGICTTTTTDGDQQFVPINGNSALIGFSARPSKKWRINFDTELFSADNSFTRISPRHLQRYKGRVSLQTKGLVECCGVRQYHREPQ